MQTQSPAFLAERGKQAKFRQEKSCCFEVCYSGCHRGLCCERSRNETMISSRVGKW